jgi:RNA-directed DNA polymerase
MVGDEGGHAARGGGSPLLANVYLHYVFDLWAEVWREKVAKGE